jgi:hypothetical protein
MSCNTCAGAPPAPFYVVAPGDNTTTIAQKMGAPIARILATNPHIPRVHVNGQEVFAHLVVGQHIFRPR